jgi:Ca2+-dependent lipid-binding protein
LTPSIPNTLQNIGQIGWVQIKVIRAFGLKGVDFSGSSDPFVVVELVNSRLQTHTEYKNVNPQWDKARGAEICREWNVCNHGGKNAKK